MTIGLREKFVTDGEQTTRTWARLSKSRRHHDTEALRKRLTRFFEIHGDGSPTTTRSPSFRFSSRDIQLAKENVQRVTVSVGVVAGGASRRFLTVPQDTDGIETKLKSLVTLR